MDDPAALPRACTRASPDADAEHTLKIEAFNLAVRHRQSAEAIDLGGVIARHWRRDALRAWCLVYWPIGLGLLALNATFASGAWLLILWWLKPWFDRILLYFYSRAVFGEKPPARECVKAALATIRTGDLWADLTYRRLSPARSFVMPVSLLEEQRGAARRRRVEILGRGTTGSAIWLTFVCANFFLIVETTILAVAALLIPGDIDLQGLGALVGRLQTNPVMQVLLGSCYLLADTLVEPFYVAAGFALYLNRRSELEGWDLELAFRKMAQRLDPSGNAFASVLVASSACLFVLLGAGVTSGAHAAQWPADDAPALQAPAADAASLPAAPLSATEIPRAAESAARIRAVLADRAFGHDQEEMVWMPRRYTTPEREAPSTILVRVLEILGKVIEWGARVVLVVLLIAGLWWLIAFVLSRERVRGRAHHRPDFVGSMDVRPESLPRDTAAEARRLIHAGQLRRGLSLLYRACLVALIDRAGIEFSASDTEGACLVRAQGRVSGATLDYLRVLIDAWRSTAYAHRPPALPVLDGLCESWPTHFESLAPADGVAS